MPRKVSVIVALASFAVGLGIFQWGHGFVRNYGGDVVVVIFLYALASILTNWRPRSKLIAVGGLALAVECAQIFITSPGGGLQQATLGAYFDPLDLVAYAVGLLIAVYVESRAESQKTPSSQS